MTALHIPDITDDMDNLTAALAYAESGWYLVPVRKGTKHPGSVVGDRWHLQSSRDPKVIAAWYSGTDYGIALHCGRSGAVILDVDNYDNIPDPIVAAIGTTGCPHQSSRPDQPGRGHYLFANTTGRRLGNGLGTLATTPKFGEVRGANGVILAAPSVHPEGGKYQWITTGAVPPIPDYLAEALPDSTDAGDTATDAEVAEFLAAHTTGTRPTLLIAVTNTLAGHIEGGASRHESMVSATAWAMREAAAGFYPAQAAVDAIKPVFVNAVLIGENKRTPRAAADEFAGALAWAVAQAKSADLDALRERVNKSMPEGVSEVDAEEFAAAPPVPITLAEAHAVFLRWLGADYDTDALDAMIATAAVERFEDGSDLVWLLLVSGPGNAKTETVQALDGIGAVVTSCISSEAALLSATSKRERAKDATGGLLRKIGDRGVLVIKDVTSILSMNRDLRARVLAALREVYDGRWSREVGTDGGQSIPWAGRIAVIGAVTTAWDTAHAVVSSMGDRFVLVRLDSTTGRQRAGRQAIGNTGSEPQMRTELAAAVAGVIAGMNTVPVSVTEAETDVLLAAADLVTLARTGVEYDYRGDVIDAHAPEMPTRFAKQLAQIVRGAVAVGIDRAQALRLAIRCARDSMPPLRLSIIDELAVRPHSTTTQIRKQLEKPHNTVDRQLQALHALGVVRVEEVESVTKVGAPRWHYSLAHGIEPGVLTPTPFPEMSVDTPIPHERETETEKETDDSDIGTDISGNGAAPTPKPATDEQNARFRAGQCVDCGQRKQSAGRPRCEDCHRSYARVMNGYE